MQCPVFILATEEGHRILVMAVCGGSLLQFNLIACGGSPLELMAWLQSISVLMPVVVTAD